MTFNEFVADLRGRVDKFESYWKEENAKDKDEFPMEFDPEIWEEQWEAWQSFGQ
jgi:hypothetical protein